MPAVQWPDTPMKLLEAVSKPILAEAWLGLSAANPQKTTAWGLTTFNPSHSTWVLKLHLITALLLVLLASSHVAETQEMITLAHDGRTDYRIVQSNRATEPDADDPAVNEWDAYISLKLQRPAYVKGSR